MKGVPLGEINPQLLIEKGILSEGIDPKILALSKVLNALRSCSYQDSLWALKHSVELLEGKETPPLSYGDAVIEITSQSFGFDVVALKGNSRSAELSSARQVAMYILWESGKYTLDHIGKLLGGRAPSTVSHGFQTVMSRMKTDTTLRLEVNKLLVELKPTDEAGV